MIKKLTMLLMMQCLFVAVFAQYPLKGTVKNEQGEMLAGASVVLKNTFEGTTTNPEGEFWFKKLKKGTYLLNVSFIGYETKTIQLEIPLMQTVGVVLKTNNIMTEEVLVSATRAKSKVPVAYSDVSKDEIESKNMGQDIPYLLSLSPSFVTTSDAGAGVGYTTFRIRGTDMNRIHVSINGIPMNDAESHSTFWVDIPDLAASTDNIQVQRGVGTSTNGAAAFGATINLQTTTINPTPYAEYNGSAGSFNTFRNSVSAGSGLLNGKFTVDARLSKVSSDGYIDRASSDLKSYFVSAAYYSGNTILKANLFSGFEETYQAWNGVPSELLKTNRTYNEYTYENQVDHYQQDYYQLFFSHKFNEKLSLNTALHYTYGRGYYENFKEGANYSDYKLTAPVGLTKTDLVNRKWLDNDFYGTTFSLNYKQNCSEIIFGGAYSVYDGDHFGRVIWVKNASNFNSDHEWYRGTGVKKDFNLFGKYNYQLSRKVNLYADLQYRHIDYQITGTDDDLRDLTQTHLFNFFNPKFGLFYKPADNQEAYFSFARANREPNRSNYVDADPKGKQPVSESLNDFELGYTVKSPAFIFGANVYYMVYNDQLILTGEINDVGSPIMVNVDKSHRAGIELQTGWKISPKLSWDVNMTFSQNKVVDFTEYVDNWDTWGQEVYHLGKTDLAFSPSLVGNSLISYKASERLMLQLSSSYVGKQYIDNTSSDERKLDAYCVSNFQLDYTVKQRLVKEMKIRLQVNNLFDAEYESNAWIYSYLSEGNRLKLDGYFPQAGIHFQVGVNVKF